MSELNCTPSSLLKKFSCLNCLSEKELLAVIVYALAIGNGYDDPGGIAQMLKDTACFNCMSDKDLMQAITAIAGNLYLDEIDLDDARQDIMCLTCASPKQLKAALTFLLCNTANNQILDMHLLDSGIAQLAAGAATVPSTSTSSTNVILLTYYDTGGGGGGGPTLSYLNVMNGVSFNISSSNPSDSGLVSWAILAP